MDSKLKKNIIGGVIAAVFVLGGVMAGIPQYQMYVKTMRGKSDLEEAKYSKQIVIEEALAQKESATLLKEVQIIQAQAISESNKIINDSLTDKYLQYQFIQTLNSDTVQTIYVATEAGLPVLEAGRFLNK